MVFFLVALDPVDDSSSPLNNQGLQTVALVKVGVHVLFHGFSGLSRFFAFLVETGLLRVHVSHEVFQLP